MRSDPRARHMHKAVARIFGEKTSFAFVVTKLDGTGPAIFDGFASRALLLWHARGFMLCKRARLQRRCATTTQAKKKIQRLSRARAIRIFMTPTAPQAVNSIFFGRTKLRKHIQPATARPRAVLDTIALLCGAHARTRFHNVVDITLFGSNRFWARDVRARSHHTFSE